MAEHKECKYYEGCFYRNDIGTCPNWCAQFKHKDDVRVVRCKDCKHRAVGWNNGEYQCVNPYYGMASGVELRDDDFCSYGERRTDA